MLSEKKSDRLRRRKAMESRSWIDKLRAKFRKPADPVSGVDKLELYTTYLHALRPWDSKPSEEYQEILRQRSYWYDNPPSVFTMMGFLTALVVLNVVIAFVPFAANWTHFQLLWRDLKKPTWNYEETAATVFAWLLSHICCALAPWFVYLAGGWVHNAYKVVPYFLMLFCETVLTDILFYARRLDFAWMCTAVCGCTGLVAMVSMGMVTKLSSAALLPTVMLWFYLTALFYAMADLNGIPYTPAV